MPSDMLEIRVKHPHMIEGRILMAENKRPKCVDCNGIQKKVVRMVRVKTQVIDLN